MNRPSLGFDSVPILKRLRLLERFEPSRALVGGTKRAMGVPVFEVETSCITG